MPLQSSYNMKFQVSRLYSVLYKISVSNYINKTDKNLPTRDYNMKLYNTTFLFNKLIKFKESKSSCSALKVMLE